MPVIRLAGHGADRGCSARGHARAMTAQPRPGGAAGRPAALQGPDERGRMRNRLPWQRSQRESARCHSEDGNGQHGGRAQPRQAPPVQRAGPRRPERLTNRSENRLQPGPDGLQPAQRTPCHRGIPGHHPRDRHRAGPGQPGADPLQAVFSGLYGVRCRVQRAAHNLVIITIALAHASRSSTARSDDMARAVWLLTAPLLIPIAAAI